MAKNAKDRLDGHLVAWFVGSPMKDDRCLYCDKGYAKNVHSCYIERVLPGVNVRPHTLHRMCFAAHKKCTTADAARQRKAVDLAERTF